MERVIEGHNSREPGETIQHGGNSCIRYIYGRERGKEAKRLDGEEREAEHQREAVTTYKGSNAM